MFCSYLSSRRNRERKKESGGRGGGVEMCREIVETWSSWPFASSLSLSLFLCVSDGCAALALTSVMPRHKHVTTAKDKKNTILLAHLISALIHSLLTLWLTFILSGGKWRIETRQIKRSHPVSLNSGSFYGCWRMMSSWYSFPPIKMHRHVSHDCMLSRYLPPCLWCLVSETLLTTHACLCHSSETRLVKRSLRTSALVNFVHFMLLEYSAQMLRVAIKHRDITAGSSHVRIEDLAMCLSRAGILSVLVRLAESVLILCEVAAMIVCKMMQHRGNGEFFMLLYALIKSLCIQNSILLSSTLWQVALEDSGITNMEKHYNTQH